MTVLPCFLPSATAVAVASGDGLLGHDDLEQRHLLRPARSSACRARSRGAARPRRSCAIGIDEVFEAKIARRVHLLDGADHLLLEREVLEHRLDDHVHRAEARPVGGGGEEAQLLVALAAGRWSGASRARRGAPSRSRAPCRPRRRRARGRAPGMPAFTVTYAMPLPMSPPPSTPTLETGRGFTAGSSTPVSFFSAVVAKKISMSRRATSETASCAEALRLRLEPAREAPVVAVLDRLERPQRRGVMPLRLREHGLPRLAEEQLAPERVLLERDARSRAPPGSPCASAPRAGACRSRARARAARATVDEELSRDDLVDEADPERLLRLHRLAGEDEVERGLDARRGAAAAACRPRRG